jgi:hypothetical protein
MLWGLAMITPDLVRVVQPLGAFGFYANNDGLIYDVTGPFADESSSPAWQAGIRIGDRLDMSRLSCSLEDLNTCGDALAAFGGVQYLLPGRTANIALAAQEGNPARQAHLVATQRQHNFLVRAVLVLDQIAGILVIVAAAWLVWTRPSAMSWGFFLYANWFNPGQAYAFYAILQQWPVALLVQDALACFAQAVGYAGLILFVIRAPNDHTEPRWRPVERALPYLAIALALGLLASYGNVVGFKTEATTRFGILAGFPVALLALTILLMRRDTQRPEDYQRLRWVFWGCFIGLPAFLIAELAFETTVLVTAFGDFTPSEPAIGLLYLVNGVLCLFVFEAVRHSRVVSVTIPLRRVTILGFLLSAPVLFLHHQAERIQEELNLPVWAWLLIGVVIVFLLSRLHEVSIHAVERYFNRALDKAEHETGTAMLHAKHPADLDRLLVNEPFRVLKLTSAAAFRRQGDAFLRDGSAKGWDGATAETLDADAPMLEPLSKGKPFGLTELAGSELALPSGLNRPVLAVPAANPIRCFAVSLYGPHASGTDLDANERAMLGRLAGQAAAMYAELESSELRDRVISLERELSAATPSPATPSIEGNGHKHGDL